MQKQTTTPACKFGNGPACNDALKRRGSLTIWFGAAMSGMPCRPSGVAVSRTAATPPSGVPDHEVLFGAALRRTTRLVESLLRLAGLAWSVPGSSTLSRRNTPDRGHLVSRVGGPLYLLIDSGTLAELRGSRRNLWRCGMARGVAASKAASMITPRRRWRPSERRLHNTIAASRWCKGGRGRGLNALSRDAARRLPEIPLRHRRRATAGGGTMTRIVPVATDFPGPVRDRPCEDLGVAADLLVPPATAPAFAETPQLAPEQPAVLVPTDLAQPPVWLDLQIVDATMRLPDHAMRPVMQQSGQQNWSGIARSWQVFPQRPAHFDVEERAVAVIEADPETNRAVEAPSGAARAQSIEAGILMTGAHAGIRATRLVANG